MMMTYPHHSKFEFAISSTFPTAGGREQVRTLATPTTTTIVAHPQSTGWKPQSYSGHIPQSEHIRIDSLPPTIWNPLKTSPTCKIYWSLISSSIPQTSELSTHWRPYVKDSKKERGEKKQLLNTFITLSFPTITWSLKKWATTLITSTLGVILTRPTPSYESSYSLQASASPTTKKYDSELHTRTPRPDVCTHLPHPAQTKLPPKTSEPNSLEPKKTTHHCTAQSCRYCPQCTPL